MFIYISGDHIVNRHLPARDGRWPMGNGGRWTLCCIGAHLSQNMKLQQRPCSFAPLFVVVLFVLFVVIKGQSQQGDCSQEEEIFVDCDVAARLSEGNIGDPTKLEQLTRLFLTTHRKDLIDAVPDSFTSCQELRDQICPFLGVDFNGCAEQCRESIVDLNTCLVERTATEDGNTLPEGCEINCCATPAPTPPPIAPSALPLCVGSRRFSSCGPYFGPYQCNSGVDLPDCLQSLERCNGRCVAGCDCDHTRNDDTIRCVGSSPRSCGSLTRVGCESTNGECEWLEAEVLETPQPSSQQQPEVSPPPSQVPTTSSPMTSPNPTPTSTTAAPELTTPEPSSTTMLDLSVYGYNHVWNASEGGFFIVPPNNPGDLLTSKIFDNVSTLSECAALCQEEDTPAGSWSLDTSTADSADQQYTCYCENVSEPEALYCLEPCVQDIGYTFSINPQSFFESCEQSLCQWYYQDFKEYCDFYSFDSDACNNIIAGQTPEPPTEPPTVKTSGDNDSSPLFHGTYLSLWTTWVLWMWQFL